MSQESKLREEICCIGASLYQRGYTVGSAGNISARLDDYLLRGRPLPSVTVAYVAALTGTSSARITATNTDEEVTSARPESALFFVNHAGKTPTSSAAASSSLFVSLTTAPR